VSAERIVVIGIGYVGLPAAILLARAGHQVLGVDVDSRRVDEVNSSVLNLGEKELAEILKEPEVKKNLRAAGKPEEGDVFVIAVPSPLDHRKKIADLSYVEAAVTALLPVLRKGNLVILESTVPPLTCRDVVAPILERSGLAVGTDVLLAHCPERILPGNVFHEIVHNDRVIGGTTPEASRRARDVYARFVKGELIITDDVTAEMVKLLENTYRDVNIALANEIAAVAETLGIDPLEMIALANRHPRVNLLKPGIGVGGHCIPLDPWFIKQVDPANSRLIFAARLINDEQPGRIAAKIRKALRAVPDPRIVAVGATYKANVPDVRESPSATIVEALKTDGYRVDQYDPLVEGMQYSSLEDIARGADCLAILVEHDHVRAELQAEQKKIEAVMRTPLVLRFYENGGAPTFVGG
jgi:UDP-N-acetyl-D-mannosaminuronic acid dehydrogenase